MRLPPAFLEKLAQQVQELASGVGRVTDTDAHQLCGRAARVAFVVPAAAPFAAALRAALQDARATGQQRRRKDQRGHHAAERFAVASRWFVSLLEGRPDFAGEALELHRLVEASGPRVLRAGACDAIVFDASPWGGGAILFDGRRPVEFMTMDFTERLCHDLGTARGESAYLTFYEALTMLASLEVWCPSGGARSEVALVGDNVGALTVAVSLRGRGDLGKVCREVALRQARSGLSVAVGHLPSALNTWADALSRLSAPTPAQIPEELRDLPRRSAPGLQEL